MKIAKPGNIVRIYYTGQTEDGDIFDTDMGKPMKFKIGNNEVIPGLEMGVMGMGVGDRKKIKVSPEEGFGERRSELVETVKKSQLPDHIKPVVGQILRLNQKDDRTIDFSITKIENEKVTLDANHPLSGHTLKFEIELVDIK